MATAPTPRLRALLQDPGSWRRLEHHGEVDSTNAVAARRVAAGEPPGLVVVADHQRAGRGRLGRGWEDRGLVAPGASLLVSVLLAPPSDGPALVPLAAGLAVADALRAAGARPALKWPNDVLVPVGTPPRHRKCAGVLAESREGTGPDGRGDRAACVVVGIGVDVDWRGLERAGEAAAWGSVADSTGGPVDRWAVLADLLEALAERWEQAGGDPDALREAYATVCTTLGGPVTVTTGAGEVRGRAVGLDERGGLVVETGDGPVTVTVGDVADGPG